MPAQRLGFSSVAQCLPSEPKTLGSVPSTRGREGSNDVSQATWLALPRNRMHVVILPGLPLGQVQGSGDSMGTRAAVAML